MKMLIDGKKCDSSNNKIIEIINPATGEVFDSVPDASNKDIEKALDIARDNRTKWSEKPLYERAEILHKFVSLVKENSEEIATLLTNETGKPYKESINELDSIYFLFSGYIERAKHLYGEVMPESVYPGFEKDLIFTRREPLGIVACIIPFNYPLDLFSHKVAPALTMGNSVIVKPSSVNPLAIIKTVELLHKAGVPGSTAQVLTGAGSTLGSYLASSAKIDAITLTGSTEVGRKVAEQASRNLTRVFLELGGNDAFIVLEDADIDLAVTEAIKARIYNAGQTCCASKRFIISYKIKDIFVRKLIERISTLNIGNPMDPTVDIGPLIRESAAVEVEELVNKTIQQGTRCICGGIRNKAFYTPAVLDNVLPEMDIAKDMEIFGPVFPIITFKNDDEAIKIANNSIYGLMGSVFTSDMKKAMKFADRMQSGGVVINGSGNYRTPEIAFGGYKKSGIGREGISVTLEEFSQIKTYVFKNIR